VLFGAVMKKTALTFTLMLAMSLMFGVQFVYVVESQSTFTDNFDSVTLSSEWQMIDPSGGSTFNLTANSGWLRINITSPPDRELNSSIVNAPRIMMEGISGDFTVETRVNATMTESEVSAGILVWKDDAHFIRLDMIHMELNMTDTEYRDALWYRFKFIGGRQYTTLIGSADINSTYLRIVRKGSWFTGEYSSDGINWVLVNTLNYDYFDIDVLGEPVDVGLYVTSVDRDGAFYADFDYFNMEVRLTPSPTPTSSPSPSPKASIAPTPTASPTPVPTPFPTPTPTPTDEPQETEQDMTAGVLFAVISIAVFLGLLFYFIKRK